MHVIEELELYRLAEFNRHRAAWGLWATEPEDLNEQLLAVRINPQSDTYRNSIDNFLGNLDVNPIRRSNLVEMRFSSQDPCWQPASRTGWPTITSNGTCRCGGTLRSELPSGCHAS